MILLAFPDIEGLTKETAEKIHLGRVLDVALNRVGGQRTYQFPASAVRIARNAFDRYEAQGWGADPNNDLLDPDEASRSSSSPSPAPASKKRRLSSITAERSSPTAEQPRKRLTLPSPTHPIYGRQGIMRGILIQHGKKTSYKFGNSTLRSLQPPTSNHRSPLPPPRLQSLGPQWLHRRRLVASTKSCPPRWRPRFLHGRNLRNP